MATSSLISKHQKGTNRRAGISIMVRILTENNSMSNKASIMRKYNLNYKQMEIYKQTLLEKKLLAKEIDDGQVTFVVTQRGKDFIRNFRALQAKMSGKF